uniref:DNA repair protein REV1 n=1 Tax=Bracon brevicornis TaxID=1563983 RepID=A0A6V7LHD0_9HYME
MDERKKRKQTWTVQEVQNWGTYMAAKKAKLEEQFEELAESEFQHATNIFKGIAIFVNGYTNPCADVLKRLMMEHGGIYHHYQRTNITTHLIASNLPYSKIIQYRKSKNPLPLCKPEWITDSIKANKLLDWRPYLLFSNQSVTQPQLQFKNKNNSTTGSEDIQDAAEEHENAIQEDTVPLNKAQDEVPPESTTNPPELEAPTKSPKSNEFRPPGTALCSKNEEFLTEFYNNSRLHHISTMGATFKEYVNELRSNSTGSFPGLDRLKGLNKKTSSRVPVNYNSDDSDEDLFAIKPEKSHKNKGTKESVIMHIDMDCFFVSVGLRKHPELRGMPIAVAHAKGNKSKGSNQEEEIGSMSEIASCSYEARKAGLKNGMFLGQALKLCPNLKTIRYDFEGYKEVSYTLYNTVASYTLEIEAVSCDEMYADVSKILNETNLTPMEFAEVIRAEIKEKTGCPVSTGFGASKLQARLATKKAKPDGQFHLKSKDVDSYIGSIHISDIPGVGWSTMHQLKKMNVELCRDLQEIPLHHLQKEFGKKTGEMLYNTCRGIDNAKLNTEHVRKSVSCEVNYGIRFENDDDARNFLRKLCKEVTSRLLKANSKGRSVTLKLLVRAKDAPIEPKKFMGCGVCDSFTKSKNLMTSVDDDGIITREILTLWEQMQQPAKEIRGIGIQISRLESVKAKSVNTDLMKFMAKGKLGESERREQVIAEIHEEAQTSSHSSGQGKKEAIESKKQQGIKAFFSTRKSSQEQPKAHSKYIEKNEKIDEAVLAELPEDIRREIMNAQHEEIGRNPQSTVKEVNNEDEIKSTVSEESEPLSQKFLSSSQGIDEDVLTELPEEIRNEILATKPMIKKSTGINDYFKNKKPGTSSSSKAKIPTVQELDMEVLIELPDDIRNEILNEYRAHKNENARNNETTEPDNESAKIDKKTLNKSEPMKNKNESNDLNCSFSQVDPEFLAALDQETRNDVKRYCLAKKNEKEAKLKKQLNEKPPQPSTEVKLKKRGRKPKALALPTKTPLISRNKPIERKKEIIPKAVRRRPSFLEHEISILDEKDMPDKKQSQEMENFNLKESNVKTNENHEMLRTLVNYLFTLPIQHVKRQIQTWIVESTEVNEIDSLSIRTYLSMLPKEKRIEDLHVLMKTMHR